MKVEKDPFINFTLPKGAKFLLVARYIPAYMGADNPPFMRFYHKVEDMENDVKKLEQDGSTSDIFIAHVIKEHMNVNR